MEDWRRTAEEASIQNLIDINKASKLVQGIYSAHAYFTRAAKTCGRSGQGLPFQPGAGEAPPHLRTAIDSVRFALLATSRRVTSHAALGHVFSTSTARIGLQGTAPWWWQRWEGHHADAAAHADMALQRLQSACSHVAAFSHIGNLMRESLPLRDAWGPAADQHLRGAIDDLAMARAALERMRPAVVAEFSDAWMLLSR